MSEPKDEPYIDPPKALGIYKAIAGVMADVAGVAKDRTNPHHGFQYTGHDDVTFALRAPFLKYGIVQCVTTLGLEREAIETRKGPDNVCRVHVLVRWVCLQDGSVFDAHSYGESSLAGTTADLQVGKAVSYAVKVAQLKTFMLLGGYEDPEKTAGQDPQQVSERIPAPATEVNGEPVPVSEETIRAMEDEYQALQPGKDGEEKQLTIRKMIDKLMKRLSSEQYERLAKADESASKRLTA